MAITKQKRITVYKTAINNQHVHQKKKTKVQQQLINFNDEMFHQHMDYELSPFFPTPRCRCQSVHMRECLGIRSFPSCNWNPTFLQQWSAKATTRSTLFESWNHMETIEKKLPPWDTERAGPRLPHWGLMLSRKTLVFWFSFKLMSAYTNYHESHVPSKIFFSWTE